MKYLASAILFFLLVGSVFSANLISCDSIIKKMGDKLSIPSSASSFFNGEKVNLIFPSNPLTEEIKVNGKVGNRGLENLKCGINSKADYEISISYAAALDLSTSKDSIKTFVKYMKSNDIKISANGILPSIKLAIAKSVFGFYN